MNAGAKPDLSRGLDPLPGRDGVPTPAMAASLRMRLATLLALFAIVAGGSFARIHTTLVDPGFDAARPEGLLKSDPGLLYYVTERIVAAHGLSPDDFRADLRVEHPLATDLPALLAVGEEFLVAWAFLLFAHGAPLHLVCLVVMSIVASLAAIGVYLLAGELTRSRALGLCAALAWSLLPANYRTIGFLLVDEDLALPLFALHLGLAARALRIGTLTSILFAALALVLALATWHATSFLFALEMLCVFAWFLARGRSPFDALCTWIMLPVLLAAALWIPVLRAGSCALSAPMLFVVALASAALARRSFGSSVAQSKLVALVVAVGGASVSSALGSGAYSHVYRLAWAKLVNLGQRPADPRALPFEARILWQGPFETLAPLELALLLGVALLGLYWALPMAWRFVLRRQSDADRTDGVDGAIDARAIVGLFTVVSLPAAWFIGRSVLLAGLLAPVCCALALADLRLHGQRQRARWLALAGLAIQALLFTSFLAGHSIRWYQPPSQRAEIQSLLAALPAIVPPGEAVAADFVNSTAILAHAARPIVFQPKWESRATRERLEEFLTAYFEGTPDDLRRLLRERWHCHFLLVDRAVLGRGCRYAAGLAAGSEPRPGTCAALFQDQDATRLEGVPGFRLRYRSPPSIRQADGSSSDFMRLYELDP